MIRFWSGGTVDFSYTVTSTAAKLEFSPGAIEVCDRGGVPHRIETNQPPIPIRLTLDIYENVLALENGEDIRLDDFLIGIFKGGTEITLMESTRNKAYKCFIESLDERIAAGRDRMKGEPELVSIVLLITDYGVFTDWNDIFSITWGI